MHGFIVNPKYPVAMASLSNRRGKNYPVWELVTCLEAAYGSPPPLGRFGPMDELVSCILSQHTSDANSYPAFERLKVALPTWEELVAAGPEHVADIVRSAGLANQKAKSIIGCLEAIKEKTGKYEIDFLGAMPIREARDWLTELPGVGPKTASIVLCFAFGMPVVPVDTHVYRVSWRLGLIREGIGENKAHDLLLQSVPGELAYRFHMALIQHGRQTCKAPTPLCSKCTVTDLCRWFQKGGLAKHQASLKKSRLRQAARKKGVHAEAQRPQRRGGRISDASQDAVSRGRAL
jgi:endonuclease-3